MAYFDCGRNSYRCMYLFVYCVYDRQIQVAYY